MRVSYRTLYSPQALGMDKHDRFQQFRSRPFEHERERYISRVRQYLDSEDSKLMKDDLLNVVALADSEEHLDLIERMIGSNLMTQCSLDNWGTAVARVYFKMNELDRIYALLTDSDNAKRQFFNQQSTYRIVMSMLFDAGRFEEVAELYNLYRSMNPTAYKDRLRRLEVIVIASYAKIGTPQALEEAIEVFDEESGSFVFDSRCRRTISYLAVINGNDTLALNMIADNKSKHILTNSIRILALFNLKRHEDALIEIRRLISDMKDRTYKLITQDAYDKMLSKMEHVENQETLDDISQVLKEVNDHNLVEQKSMEDIIFSKIRPRIDDSNENRFQGRDQFRQGRDNESRDQSDRPRGNFQYGLRGDYKSRDGFSSGNNYRNRVGGSRDEFYDEQ